MLMFGVTGQRSPAAVDLYRTNCPLIRITTVSGSVGSGGIIDPTVISETPVFSALVRRCNAPSIAEAKATAAARVVVPAFELIYTFSPTPAHCRNPALVDQRALSSSSLSNHIV